MIKKLKLKILFKLFKYLIVLFKFNRIYSQSTTNIFTKIIKAFKPHNTHQISLKSLFSLINYLIVKCNFKE